MIKIGIIGGAGYTAGELLRILIHHRKTQIKFVHSNSNAGKPVTDVHKDLIGETNIAFTDELPFCEIDALFLCLGHGEAKGFLEKHPVPANIHIIDLSQDFRIQAPGHDYVYGLPELNKDAIRHAQHIANPGCFATAIQLAILPLASAHLLKDEVHVNAITGSTGAGQKPTDTTHFSWRNNNVSAYEIFKHRHLKEIGQSIRQLQPGFHHDVNFIPINKRCASRTEWGDCCSFFANKKSFFCNNMIIISGRRTPARSVSHYICDFFASRQRKRTQSDGHIRVWTGSIFSLIFVLSFSHTKRDRGGEGEGQCVNK